MANGKDLEETVELLSTVMTVQTYGTEARMAALFAALSKLMKRLDKLERVVNVIPEGLRIKTGTSEVTILKNGGVIIKGQRVLIDGGGTSIFLTPEGKM